MDLNKVFKIADECIKFKEISDKSSKGLAVLFENEQFMGMKKSERKMITDL